MQPLQFPIQTSHRSLNVALSFLLDIEGCLGSFFGGGGVPSFRGGGGAGRFFLPFLLGATNIGGAGGGSLGGGVGGASQLLLPFLLGATNMRCAAPNCTFLRSIFSRFY